MDVNPYKPPLEISRESEARTDISFGEGLLYWLGGIALKLLVILFFAAVAIGIAAFGLSLE